MIRYSLICRDDHSFESWFQSAEAFEKLRTTGLVTCPTCGSDRVEKAIMTPRVRTSRKSKAKATPADGADLHALTAPSSAAEAAMIELKKKIQDSSEYVGGEFAREARKIHDGEAPERSIYGEANADEARRLLDDGVPVAPLPFVPSRKTN